ncbi:MAG: PQQ-binding-like beta-propeller repeat protein [Armatimonadetes bacterium]|nr:PQQ-binding-like beta-propeller repeat protein [Armatimonadota bacterium]
MDHLTRREFLAASGAVLASPWLAKWDSGPIPIQPAKIAFFSDTHVGIKSNFEQNREMFNEMKSLKSVDWGINGGDVTDYGWRREYARYKVLLDEFQIETHHIPGNHDVRWSPLGPKAFSEVCGPVSQFFLKGGIFFGLLDSSVPLSHYGHFEAQMLETLGRWLEKIPAETPVILATHHWVGRDSVMVDNELALLEVIRPYNVKLVLTGHGHSDLDWEWAGIHCTMNKGLYQGSYELIEIDPALDVIRLARRTQEQPTLEPIASIPLKSERPSKPNLFALTNSKADLRIVVKEDCEFRVSAGKWTPQEPGSLTLAPVAPGWQSLEARRGAEFETACVRTESGLKLAWEKALSGGVYSHLTLVEGSLLVSTMDGVVYKLDAQTGEQRWKRLVGGYCHSTPVGNQGVVVVGTSEGNICALDFESGELLWQSRANGPIYGTACFLKSNSVAIPSGDGTIRAFDLNSGSRLWRWHMPEGDTGFVQSKLVTDGDRIYFGGWNSRLYALAPDGSKELWSFLTPKSFAYSPAIGDPLLHEGRLFAVANGNALYCLDGANGEKVWEASSPRDKFGYSGPSVMGDVVVAGCLGDLGEVRGLDVHTGEERWCTATGQTIYDSSPAVHGEFVAIGSVSGQLNLIKGRTGELVARERLRPGHFLSSPAIDTERVYAATFNNVVAAYNLPR